VDRADVRHESELN